MGEEPTLVSVYDTGLQGSVRMCYANKSGALNVLDLTSGVIRNVCASPSAKPKFRHIIAIADGAAEEILYTCDSECTHTSRVHRSTRPFSAQM